MGTHSYPFQTQTELDFHLSVALGRSDGTTLRVYPDSQLDASDPFRSPLARIALAGPFFESRHNRNQFRIRLTANLGL